MVRSHSFLMVLAMAENDEILSPAEMRKLIDAEKRDRERERQLREKEAMAIITGYEEGKIEAAEATRRYYDYVDRWGEAFRSYLTTTEGLSDDQVLMRYEAQRRRLDRSSALSR
jgi:hypothetical protein